MRGLKLLGYDLGGDQHLVDGELGGVTLVAPNS
jgi:hypothetical protein